MKILFVTKELPYPVNNGYRTRTFSILKGLALHNEVALACFGEPDSESKNRMKGFLEDLYVVKESKPSKLSELIALIFGIFSIISYSIKKRYSQNMRLAVERILGSKDIDLIICDSIYQAINIPKNRCKNIISEHNIESTIIYRYLKVEKNIIKKIYATLEYIKMKNYENRIWDRFDHCFAVSEEDKQVIVKRARKSNVSVIPNGVDIAYFKPEENREKSFSLVYTGQMNWHPNQDAVSYFLSSTYPLIKKLIPNISFYVVGNNPPEAIKNAAKNDKSVVVTGFVDDVRSYMKKADVFVVPLRVGGGTRLKILEAMSMAKPVVSTSIGCEGLNVNNGKNIVISDKPYDFAEKVIELLNDPDSRSRIGRAGRSLVEAEYSWDKVIEALNNSIKDVVCLSVDKGQQ